MNILSLLFLLIGIALVVVGWQGTYSTVWAYLSGSPVTTGGSGTFGQSPSTGVGSPVTGGNGSNSTIAFHLGGQHSGA